MRVCHCRRNVPSRTLCAGFPSNAGNDLQELHLFNITTKTWANLSGPVHGLVPSPRESFGFTAARGIVYTFGGLGNNGSQYVSMAVEVQPPIALFGSSLNQNEAPFVLFSPKFCSPSWGSHRLRPFQHDMGEHHRCLHQWSITERLCGPCSCGGSALSFRRQN